MNGTIVCVLCGYGMVRVSISFIRYTQSHMCHTCIWMPIRCYSRTCLPLWLCAFLLCIAQRIRSGICTCIRWAPGPGWNSWCISNRISHQCFVFVWLIIFWLFFFILIQKSVVLCCLRFWLARFGIGHKCTGMWRPIDSSQLFKVFQVNKINRKLFRVFRWSIGSDYSGAPTQTARDIRHSYIHTHTHRKEVGAAQYIVPP